MTCSKKETCANYPQKCKKCGMTSDIINHHPMYQNKDITKIISGAIEKQMPKRPDYYADGYADGMPVYEYANCPVCGHEFEEGINDWGCNYCQDCGQKLDWSEEE